MSIIQFKIPENKPEQSKPEGISQSKEDDAKAKITTAKFNAMREIEMVKQKTEEFSAALKETALFPDVPIYVETIIDNFIETFKQIIINKNNIGSDQIAFNKTRADMFRQLIERYDSKK